MKSLILAFLLSLFPLLSQAAKASSGSFVFALKPDKNPETLLAERSRLEVSLTKTLNMQVKVIVPLSAAVIQEGLANGSIDAAYLSSTDMVMAEKSGVATMILAAKIKGKTSYESYWVSLKDKPYANAKDLAGKPIAFASRTSTSGYVVPVASLVASNLLKREANPEDFFGKGNVTFGTGYASAIAKVLDGSVEAAAVSDYVIDGDKHLKPEEKARLKIVARQGPVPTHVIATASSLNKATRAAVEKALTSMPSELRDQLFNSELVKVNSSAHLQPTKRNFELTGITL